MSQEITQGVLRCTFAVRKTRTRTSVFLRKNVTLRAIPGLAWPVYWIAEFPGCRRFRRRKIGRSGNVSKTIRFAFVLWVTQRLTQREEAMIHLTFDQIAAIRTCLHHTIRRFEEKSITTTSHCGGVPQIECGGINVTAEIMEVLAVAEASLTDEQQEMLPEVI